MPIYVNQNNEDIGGELPKQFLNKAEHCYNNALIIIVVLIAEVILNNYYFYVL